MTLRLLAKEIAQHHRVALGVAVLAAAQVALLLAFVLTQESPTLLRAATAFTWGGGPILAAYSARRLFVLEHEQGTIHLLRTLPVDPSALAALKLGLALVVNLTVNLGILWGMAALVDEQELISLGWLARLSAQVGTYVVAWLAMAVLMAHLGVYRYAAWLLVLLLLGGLDDVVYEPARSLFWTAPLADPLEATRYAAPWDGVRLALGWALAALAATFALVRYRGGALVDAWYTPMTGRRRAQVTGAAFAVLVGYELLVDLAKSQPEAPLGLPRVGRVEIGAEPVRGLAERVSDSLDQIAETYALDLDTRVVLSPRRDDRVEPVLTTLLGDRDLFLGVDTTFSQDRLHREAVSDVLNGRAAFLLERNQDAGVWAVGFAAHALGADDPQLLADVRRRAAALADGEITLAPYDRIRARHGRSGAEALGWAAWAAVDALGGPAATKALAGALFGPARSRTGAALIGAQAADPREVLEELGIDAAAHRAAVKGILTREATGAPHPETLSPPVYRPDPRQLGRLIWALPPGLDPARAELWWSVTEPLSAAPAPAGTIHRVPVVAAHGSALVPEDPRHRVVATWVIDGVVQGWREVATR